MRPICLIGGFNMAQKWVEQKINDEESLILMQDASMEEIKQFRSFLYESSFKNKIGIIYFFNNLHESKQAVFLKIFEDLPVFSKVIIHGSSFVSFTIHTRCDIIFLKRDPEISKNSSWLLTFFKNILENASLTNKVRNGIEVYLETLNLKENGFLSENEKESILEDLV